MSGDVKKDSPKNDFVDLMSFTRIGYHVTAGGELVPVDSKAQEEFSRSMEKQILRSAEIPPRPR